MNHHVISIQKTYTLKTNNAQNQYFFGSVMSTSLVSGPLGRLCARLEFNHFNHRERGREVVWQHSAKPKPSSLWSDSIISCFYSCCNLWS